MKMNFEWLRSVRSIITIMIVGVYCILAFKGVMKPEDVQTIVMAMIVFYFTKNRGGNGNGQISNSTGN